MFKLHPENVSQYVNKHSYRWRMTLKVVSSRVRHSEEKKLDHEVLMILEIENENYSTSFIASVTDRHAPKRHNSSHSAPYCLRQLISLFLIKYSTEITNFEFTMRMRESNKSCNCSFFFFFVALDKNNRSRHASLHTRPGELAFPEFAESKSLSITSLCSSIVYPIIVHNIMACVHAQLP